MWAERVPDIEAQLKRHVSLEAIGMEYGVSKQRMYQVLEKFGLETGIKTRRNKLRGKPPSWYWLNRILVNKGIDKDERDYILENLEKPEKCPVFGTTLNYLGTGNYRTDDSPSIDQIDAGKGYTRDNVQILSWRANRIKNDSTPAELRLLADYMEQLDRKSLQL